MSMGCGRGEEAKRLEQERLRGVEPQEKLDRSTAEERAKSPVQVYRGTIEAAKELNADTAKHHKNLEQNVDH
jgi:hypothetical protein